MKSSSTIDQIYNQYKLQDWSFDSVDADNLNPKREMLMSQVTQIEKAIQDLTDDIIRKKISPEKDDINSLISASFGGESTIGNIGKNIAAMNAGSSDGTIFGEGFSSDIEEEIALLQADLSPTIVDCENILKKYGFNVAPSDEIQDNDGEVTFVVNTSNSSNMDFSDTLSSLASGASTTGIINMPDDSMQKCGEADLVILKIFLAILKIFQKILRLLQYLIEIPTIISEIIYLISQAWINPPSIAMVVNIILGLVISTVIALISMLVQFLWNLLGLDCIAVQSIEILDNISNLMSSFKNTAAKINIGTVNVLFDGISSEISSLSSLIRKSINDMGEDWDEAMNSVKDFFSEEGLASLKETAINTAVNTLSDEYHDAISGRGTYTRGIDGAINSINNSALIEKAKEKAVKQYNQMLSDYSKEIDSAVASADMIKENFIKGQNIPSKIVEIISDITVDGLEIE